MSCHTLIQYQKNNFLLLASCAACKKHGGGVHGHSSDLPSKFGWYEWIDGTDGRVKADWTSVCVSIYQTDALCNGGMLITGGQKC